MQQIAAADRSRGLSWDTADTRPGEQFAYYREAICQAFMNLTPEPPATLLPCRPPIPARALARSRKGGQEAQGNSVDKLSFFS